MTQQNVAELFQSTLQKTQDWLNEFIEQTGQQDEQKAWQMMRGSMHVLRDRLTVQQAAHLGAQLPMLVRGMYYEGYRPSDQPTKISSRDELIQAVAEALSDHPEVNPKQALEGTVQVLNSRISPGELEDIRKVFPQELQGLWVSD
ncbi:MAG: DUF2267 domain-containing protein [Phycisphaerae bacterium]